MVVAALCGMLSPASIHAAASAAAPSAAPETEELSISPEEIMKPWTGDLDGMIDRGFIRVLTVYSKTFYFVDKGVQMGAVPDVFRVFEEELNRKLASEGRLKGRHLKVRVVFIPMTRGDIWDSLAAGKGDVAASSLGVSQERRKQVDFSVPMISDVRVVIVSGPGSPQISGVDDLAGKEVFVRKSSAYYSILVDLNRRFAAENKPAVLLKEAPETLEDEDLLEMSNAGLIPLTVSNNYLANFWKQIFPNINVHDATPLHSGGEVAWALRKDSPQLKAVVDDFVTRNRKGSLIGNQIITRYLKSTKYVADATSEAERKKLLAVVPLFQTYGAQYNVDWLLMVAQGYQESRLDHSVRSPVGAIGMMQIMPATGQELKVGDIRELEPNIHAGVKYMRWMIDHYYANEPISTLDKALFAFASYNAGAGRIAQLRKEAARRGLDPNVWFRNVEYVAAEKVGAETVTYVANIYKYYIAYHLAMEARDAREKAADALKSEME
jgi:membrane-bound lytic murein transglycosylase MltF